MDKKITQAERLHDVWCPDVGLGCNMLSPDEVHRCIVFVAVTKAIEEERLGCLEIARSHNDSGEGGLIANKIKERHGS